MVAVAASWQPPSGSCPISWKLLASWAQFLLQHLPREFSELKIKPGFFYMQIMWFISVPFQNPMGPGGGKVRVEEPQYPHNCFPHSKSSSHTHYKTNTWYLYGNRRNGSKPHSSIKLTSGLWSGNMNIIMIFHISTVLSSVERISYQNIILSSLQHPCKVCQCSCPHISDEGWDQHQERINYLSSMVLSRGKIWTREFLMCSSQPPTPILPIFVWF